MLAIRRAENGLKMKVSKNTTAFALIASSILIAIVFVYISAQRELTALEGALLQIMVLITSLIGSYIFGRQSATSAAKDIIKPSARSAFRRLTSLYNSLERLASILAQSQGDGAKESHEVTIAKLKAIVLEQILTADHAMEDWRDIVPEDVNELYIKIQKSREVGEN